MSEVEFLVGREVIEVRSKPDGSTLIIFERGDGAEPRLYASLGSGAHYDVTGGTAAGESFVGKVVSSTSTEGGTLALRFASGESMRCEPDADYEAWQVVGGWPQSLVVCTPGGELAIVDSTHVPSTEEAQRTIDQLSELTGWNVRLREVTDTGGIIVDPARADDDASSTKSEES